MLPAILLALALLTGWAWTPDLPLETVQARYADTTSRYVTVAGVRLHLRDTGPRQAPAVILLHGFGASLHTWDAWAASLSATHRVVRMDLPGAGLTGADPTGDYSDERALQWLPALMDALELPRASVVGHSMGGRLAWRLAAAHPQRVRRLVLLAPDGFASPGFEYGKAPDVPFVAHLMTVALPRVLLRMNLAPAWADESRLDDDTVTRYHELLLAPGVRQAIIDRMKQTRLREPAPLLAGIVAPTLLVWGEQDRLIPPPHAQDYLRVMPGARLVTLPGVGHLPQEELPEQGLAAVAAFLAEPDVPLR